MPSKFSDEISGNFPTSDRTVVLEPSSHDSVFDLDRSDTRRKIELKGTPSGLATVAAVLAGDCLSLCLSTVLAYGVLATSVALFAWPAAMPPLAAPIFFGAFTILAMRLNGLITARAVAPVLELRQCVLTILASSAFLAFGPLPLLFSAGSQLQVASHVGFMLLSGVFGSVLAPTIRGLIRGWYSQSDWWGRRVIVVGSDRSAVRVFRQLHSSGRSGLRPVGVVFFGADERGLSDSLGSIDELDEICRLSKVNTAVLVIGSEGRVYDELVRKGTPRISNWLVVQDSELSPSLWHVSREVAGRPAILISNNLDLRSQRVAKRVLDLLIAVPLSMVVVPLIGLLWLIIRMNSRGPAFFTQMRFGRGGTQFKMWKFRTMRVDADQHLEMCLAADPKLREEWLNTTKLKNDPRVTLVGRFLRKTSLDELPQLWNVIRGEMSFVGPRPIRNFEIDRYGEAYGYYTQVPPGITGLWQINGRSNTTYAERVDFDSYYVRNWSPWLDIYILACTVRVVLRCEGAY